MISRVYGSSSMDPDTVVLDISSDEEVGWSESRGICDGDDHNWLTELLDEVDRETDDSDDVVVVSEVVVNPKPRLKAVSLKGLDDGDVDDDDECVILDGDPDKPVAVRNDDDDGGDSDDLLVVSEKGQVACRDYPHPRHLCVQFPFSSTSHERHCGLCHCYVCDSLAPCVHWGAGSSSIDHCHATEKDEFWRLERKSMRTGDKVLPASKAADASVAMRFPQLNQIPQLPVLLQPMGGLHNQVSRPTSLRACSMSTNFPMTSQSRSQRNGCSVPTNKFQPNLVSQQLLGTYSTNSRDRRHSSGSGHLGPQLPRAAFKRTGSAGVAFTTNRCSYNSSRITHGSHYSRCPPPVVTSSRNPIRFREFRGGMVSGSNTYVGPSQPLMGNVFDSAPASIPLRFQSQLPPHPTADTPFENPVLFPSAVSPRLNGDSTSVNSVPFQSQVSVQPNYLVPSQLQMSSVTNYIVPPEPQESSLPNYSVPSPPPNDPVPSQPQVATPHNYMVPSQPQVSSQSSIPAPSEPQVNTQYIPVSNYCQSITEHRVQTQTAVDPDFRDFDFSWITRPSESSQQPSAKNFQAKGVAPTSECPLVADPGLADDFQYDSWIFDNQPVEPGNLDVTESSGLNGLSPESGLLDAGIFFDF